MNIIHAQERPFFESSFRADQMRFDAEQFGHRHRATQLNHAVLGFCDDQAADLFPSHRMSRFPLQLRVKLDRVLVNPGHAVAGAEAAHQSGRVPRCSASELALFQQNNVFPTEFGEMVRDAGANDAATCNHNFRLRRQGMIRLHSRFRKRAPLPGGRPSNSTGFH